MNQEEVDVFITQEEVVLESTNSKFSFKTNLLIIKRNFDKVRIRLTMIHRFIVFVYNLIDIDAITQNVLDNIAKNKLTLDVNYDLHVNTSVIQYGYKISRLENNLVTIEKQLAPETWIVDKLIVSVKNVEGQFLYPSIFTRNNKIEIYFLDGISSNYKVFLL